MLSVNLAWAIKQTASRCRLWDVRFEWWPQLNTLRSLQHAGDRRHQKWNDNTRGKYPGGDEAFPPIGQSLGSQQLRIEKGVCGIP